MDYHKTHKNRLKKKNGHLTASSSRGSKSTSQVDEKHESEKDSASKQDMSSHRDSSTHIGDNSEHTKTPIELHDSVSTIFKRATGNFLILFSLYMLSWVFYKPMLEEVKFAYNSLIGRSYVVAEDYEDPSANDVSTDSIQPPRFTTSQGSEKKGLLGNLLGAQTVQPLIPKDPNFSVVIPKLGANANVIKDVDSANEEEYLDALERGVAHAAGTAVPGENQHVYLFAHSTNTFSNVSRYNAIFYLLYKLEEGDEINVFYEGVRHRYTVTGKTIVDPSEVQYLTRTTEKEFLTLQTCWPPGTVAQRMLVFAEPM